MASRTLPAFAALRAATANMLLVMLSLPFTLLRAVLEPEHATVET